MASAYANASRRLSCLLDLRELMKSACLVALLTDTDPKFQTFIVHHSRLQ